MADLEKRFFVATSVVEPNEFGEFVVEKRLDSAPKAPPTGAAARTTTLYEELESHRGSAEAAMNERFKNKPPRGLDEEDAMYVAERCISLLFEVARGFDCHSTRADWWIKNMK